MGQQNGHRQDPFLLQVTCSIVFLRAQESGRGSNKESLFGVIQNQEEEATRNTQ